MTHKTTTIRIPLDLHKQVTDRIKQMVDDDGYVTISLNQWIIDAMKKALDGTFSEDI